MSAKVHTIYFGKKPITYRIVRRERRTMQISVLPDMTVEVIAPKTADASAIRGRVYRRAAWILKQIDFFRQFHPKTPDRKFEPGETHLYLGRRYRLKAVHASVASIKLVAGHIVIATRGPYDTAEGRRLVQDWQRAQARSYFEQRLAVCLDRFPDRLRFEPKSLIVRQLRLRWGSMSPSGRLMLNRSLIQAAVHEIDYVITHELCHRIHHHHGPSFFDLLNRVMPDWQKRKLSLERRMA